MPPVLQQREFRQRVLPLTVMLLSCPGITAASALSHEGLWVIAAQAVAWGHSAALKDAFPVILAVRWHWQGSHNIPLLSRQAALVDPWLVLVICNQLSQQHACS